jgi:hypothetical protein
VADECPFKTGDEDSKCRRLADTLENLYDQSSDSYLKNSITNNYCEIFKYLIRKDNNSAISRSFTCEYDYDYAISDLNNVISKYNNYSSNFSAYDYSIKNTLDQNLNNLKEKKNQFLYKYSETIFI